MGIVKDVVGGIFGSGKDAAKDASRAQLEAVEKGIDFSRESRDLAREDLAPFKEAGESVLGTLAGRASDTRVPNLPDAPTTRYLPGTLPAVQTAPKAQRGVNLGEKGLGIHQLVKNPEAQAAFIQDNPFYQALAKDATDRITANAAARGKVGSGGTAAALQDRLLLLGNELLNQNIQQRHQIADTQLRAQDQEFRQRLQSTLAQSGIDDQRFQQAMQRATVGGQLDAERFRQELQRVGIREDILNRDFSQLLNLATLGANAAAGQATATQQAASTISDLYTQGGNAQAAGIIGGFNAQRGTVNDIIRLATGGFGG